MEFIWKIGGEAGFGIMGSGLLLGKAFTRSGYYGYIYAEYPSLIKGGHNTAQMRICDRPVHAPKKTCDLLVALNRFSVLAHKDEITPNGGIIYDSKNADLSGIEIRKDIRMYDVPLLEIAEKAGGDMLMRNTVAMGATLALIGYPFEKLEAIIRETFERKGEEIVRINVGAAKGGYDYMLAHYKPAEFPIKLSPLSAKGRMLVMTGNEAIGAGAIQAGLKFFAAYPMTPASSILHYIAEKEYEHNILVKHAEDEIAAMNMVVGAFYAGARAMCSTSGGGFALKTEAIGLAALAETPAVIVLAQRTGPSTCMPTWTEQADLRFAMHASQGDFLRVLIAPGDVAEAYNLTQRAFNIAEKYQIPVIILSDKFLSESYGCVEQSELRAIPIERGKTIFSDMASLPPGERFKRYELTEDGISPRPVPGVVGGEHVATSYEHWENGFSTEHFGMRRKMVDKRARKINVLVNDIDPPTLYGPADAQLTLVCWGSHKTVVFEAVDMLQKEGLKVNALHFAFVHPLHPKAHELLHRYASQLVIVENNSTAQFGGYLREKAGVQFKGSILRYDGRQLFPEEVFQHTKSILAGREKYVVVSDNPPVEYYSAREIKV